MKGKNAKPIKELTHLPGYYVCKKCGNHYLSDFPFMKAKCLECGSRILVTEITKEELNGLLYNLNILASASLNKQWSQEQLGEFCHYEDTNRLSLLMRYLLGNGYVRFKEENGLISDLEVFAIRIALNQTKGA